MHPLCCRCGWETHRNWHGWPRSRPKTPPPTQTEKVIDCGAAWQFCKKRGMLFVVTIKLWLTKEKRKLVQTSLQELVLSLCVSQVMLCYIAGVHAKNNTLRRKIVVFDPHWEVYWRSECRASPVLLALLGIQNFCILTGQKMPSLLFWHRLNLNTLSLDLPTSVIQTVTCLKCSLSSHYICKNR